MGNNPNKSHASEINDNVIHSHIFNFFEKNRWQFSDFQKQSIYHYAEGFSGLIHSPTGTGKTLAAFLGPVNSYLQNNKTESVKTTQNSTSAEPITVLWITPLRALAADTEDSLRHVIEVFDLPWSLSRRTGDTSPAVKAKQKKRLPTCLITTPESLSLLLSYPQTATQFKSLKSVIVDEWHELLGTKRGVQLELCLARLRGDVKKLSVWGLSATVGNVNEAMNVLLGASPTQKTHAKGRLIAGSSEKEIAITSIIPKDVEKFPWAGHMGMRLLPQVIHTIENATSTLIFTNTRSQAEVWFENILKAKPEWLEQLGIHHGSLSKRVRDYAESGLKEGRLKAVVCTSSLDLGVDFSPVEQVIQIGSPKGVARLIQRAGRSGHSPNKKSEVICVPTHALELIEIAAARDAAQKKKIESRKPLLMCLDVLVQHVVTLALGRSLFEKKTFDEIKKTTCFSQLTMAQWQWVLDFITRGGDALQHYPDYKKVVRKGREFRVEDRRIARLHRMSVGTINSDSSMLVKFLKGDSVGSIEESFISKLKHGDVFLFNGRLLSLVQVRDMTAYVRLATTKKRIVPRWQGGRLPLSTTLALGVRSLVAPDNTAKNTQELASVHALLAIQSHWSKRPKANQLLIETTKSREGFHIFMYPFGGRQVNEGLAALTAFRLTRLQPATFVTSANDYGFELLSKTHTHLTPKLLDSLLSEDNLLEDVIESINASEMARRQFRDIARVAGLIIQGYPGSQKSTRQVQASSGLIYDVLKDYDAENLLLKQSLNEVLEQQIDVTQLQDSLNTIRSQEKLIVDTKKLTPLAFPLWAERLRGQIVSSEKWQDRVRRMVETLEKKVEKEAVL